MIKNKYTIIGNTVIFHIIRRNGDKYNVLIDLEDLTKIDKIGYKIHVGWHRSAFGFYAEIMQYLGMINGKPKYKTLVLHRLIMDEHNANNKIDHIDHNPLNNKKNNLRVTTQKENLKHRSGLNKNNKSGYRNVSWCNESQDWIVQLQDQNGKNHKWKHFEDVHEAGKFAKKMREEWYGEFAGRG